MSDKDVGEFLHQRGYIEYKSMNEAPVNDITPQYDNRQSFYGKARVDDNGNEKTLYSYNTPVAKIVGNKVELLPKWDWSQTTLRHVKEFLKQKDIVKWIQVMKEEVLKIKVLNEKHQIKTLFLLLFVYEVIKMKVNKLADDQKQQRKYLLKLSQFFDIDEQFIDNMMNCDSELLLKTQNQKVKTFFEIYQLLYIKEKELNGNDSQVISRSFISSSFINGSEVKVICFIYLYIGRVLLISLIFAHKTASKSFSEISGYLLLTKSLL